jgi:hypothetical protein
MTIARRARTRIVRLALKADNTVTVLGPAIYQGCVSGKSKPFNIFYLAIWLHYNDGCITMAVLIIPGLDNSRPLKDQCLFNTGPEVSLSET